MLNNQLLQSMGQAEVPIPLALLADTQVLPPPLITSMVPVTISRLYGLSKNVEGGCSSMGGGRSERRTVEGSRIRHMREDEHMSKQLTE